MSTELAKVSGVVPLDQNPVAVYLAGLTPTGRRSMGSKLGRAVEVLGYPDVLAASWPELRFQHVAAVRAKLQETGRAPATVDGTLYAVRGIVRAAPNLGLMTADDLERIRSVQPVRGERLPSGRALTGRRHRC